MPYCLLFWHRTMRWVRIRDARKHLHPMASAINIYNKYVRIYTVVVLFLIHTKMLNKIQLVPLFFPFKVFLLPPHPLTKMPRQQRLVLSQTLLGVLFRCLWAHYTLLRSLNRKCFNCYSDCNGGLGRGLSFKCM